MNTSNDHYVRNDFGTIYKRKSLINAKKNMNKIKKMVAQVGMTSTKRPNTNGYPMSIACAFSWFVLTWAKNYMEWVSLYLTRTRVCVCVTHALHCEIILINHCTLFNIHSLHTIHSLQKFEKIKRATIWWGDLERHHTIQNTRRKKKHI